MFGIVLMAALVTTNDAPNCLFLNKCDHCRQCEEHRWAGRCDRRGYSRDTDHCACEPRSGNCACSNGAMGSNYGGGYWGCQYSYGYYGPVSHDFHHDYYFGVGASSATPLAPQSACFNGGMGTNHGGDYWVCPVGYGYNGRVYYDYNRNIGYYGGAGASPATSLAPQGSNSLNGFSGQIGAAPVGKARLVLEVPEDARVFVNGALTKTTAARRVYDTPLLDVGQTFFYDFRIEVERNGKTYAENKRVIVKAGDEYQESFADLGKRPCDTAVADAHK